jgi:hypothetical protein
MANWSILTGLSGYHHDGPQGLLCFDPLYKPEDYRSLFTLAEGWGSFSQERKGGKQRNEIRLDHGKTTLRELQLGVKGRPGKITVRGAGKRLETEVSVADGTLKLRFAQPVEMAEGQSLIVELA